MNAAGERFENSTNLYLLASNSTAPPLSYFSYNGSYIRDLKSEIVYSIECHQVSQVIIGLQVICGIIGNIFNYMIFSSLSLKPSATVYLKALAVSDWMASAALIPQYLLKCHIEIVPVSKQCITEMYRRILLIPLLNSFYCASNLITLTLTIERFIAIRFPLLLKTKINNTKKVAICIVVFLWIVAFAVFTPAEISPLYKLYFMRRQSWRCLKDVQLTKSSNMKAYKWIREMSVRIIPVFAMVVLNILTLVHLRKRVKLYMSTFESGNNRLVQMATKNDKRLTVMMTALVLLYVVCIFPSACAFMIDDYLTKKDPKLYYTLISYTDIIENINYSVTFIIYFLSFKNFRRQFYKYFKCSQISTEDTITDHEVEVVENCDVKMTSI